MQNGFAEIKTWLMVLGLGYLSIMDIRKKEITTVSVFVIALAGIVLSVLGGEWRAWSVLYRYIPGILCLIFAGISREAIGYGDGLVILALGSYLSLPQICHLCLITITLAGIAALFLMLVLHRGKRTTIPLIPFLLAGYGMMLLF